MTYDMEPPPLAGHQGGGNRSLCRGIGKRHLDASPLESKWDDIIEAMAAFDQWQREVAADIRYEIERIDHGHIAPLDPQNLLLKLKLEAIRLRMARRTLNWFLNQWRASC